MYIVAFLYNDNGMASWCWEAAHALSEANQPVLLVCAPDVKLPGIPQVEILRFNLPGWRPGTKHLMFLVRNELERLSGQSSKFVGHLHQYLQQRGIQPSAYLLNQSNLQDPQISVPQHVVAWTYPTSMQGYLRKIRKSTTYWRISKHLIRLVMNSVGWHRKDWRAYRSATSVLAVSKQLTNELKKQGINAYTVYPGTNILETPKKVAKSGQPPKLLTAAVNLEEPRKRVRWLLEALKANPCRQYSLTLVGTASEEFKRWACEDEFPAIFTGPLPRQELQQLMAEHDLFLFGSCLDDWGYVLIEAMSQGLCIIAPNIYPFNEIVSNPENLFPVDSQDVFCQTLNVLLASDLPIKNQNAWKRAKWLFSREAFGKTLVHSVAKGLG